MYELQMDTIILLRFSGKAEVFGSCLDSPHDQPGAIILVGKRQVVDNLTILNLLVLLTAGCFD